MASKFNQPRGATIGVLRDGRTTQEAIDAIEQSISEASVDISALTVKVLAAERAGILVDNTVDMLTGDYGYATVVNTSRYASDSVWEGSTFIRVPARDTKDRAGKDWHTYQESGRPALWDSKGNCFEMEYRDGGYVSVESLGGGNAGDDTNYLAWSQFFSVGPVHLRRAVYNYSHPIKHYSNRGWIGHGATVRSIGAPNKGPFISAPRTLQGAPNDVINGTTDVSGIVMRDLIVDVNYTDTTGAAGFEFGENTLDGWTSCLFENVSFVNGKFDNLGIQWGCEDLLFDRCLFDRAGEDAVTLRHTCKRIAFRNCRIWSTAKVSHKVGGFFGDGIVVKAQFVIIQGCHFRNVGNNIKGAGIANNAEDVEDPSQASYGVFVDNFFENCYGGIGVGTVNPDFIAAGKYITNMIVDNNVFVNTVANAIGFRYVKSPTLGMGNSVVRQTHSSYFAVEVIECIDLDGQASVKSAVGGGLLVRNCTGAFRFQGSTISTGAALNGVTITDCDGFDLDVSVTDVWRTGVAVDNVRNSRIVIRGKAIQREGLKVTAMTRCTVVARIATIYQGGAIFDTVTQSNLQLDISDAGTSADASFYGVRLSAGNGNLVNVTSHHTQSNRPTSGLSFGADVRGTGYNVVTSGTHGGVVVDAGAIVTKGFEVK